MNKEEYTKVSIGVPTLSDFQIKEGINNGLNLIEEINKLVIEDERERYIRELLNRIDKAINKIKDLYEFGNEWHWDNGAIEDEVREIEEILGGKNEK